MINQRPPTLPLFQPPQSQRIPAACGDSVPCIRIALTGLLLAFGVSCTGIVPEPQAPVIAPKPNALAAGNGSGTAAAKTDAAPVFPETDPLSLTLQDAMLGALASNQSLAVQKLSPQIVKLAEDQARAAFDPSVTGSVTAGHSRNDGIAGRDTNNPLTAQLAVEEFLPTGTLITLGGSVVGSRPGGTDTSADQSATTASLSVTQSLLRGAGLDVNLATLRQRRLDTLASMYELRGFAQTLLADTEKGYWDYVLARRQLEIVQKSLELAEQQRKETSERIRIGNLAGYELAAADAEVALRQENLINARSNLAKTRINLLRLLNPGGAGMWSREVETRTVPALAEIALEPVETHVELARRLRPELNQARLAIRRNELELVKTKNGLLPKLDLFMALGGTGYADSFTATGRAVDGNNYSAAAGLAFDWPVFNRAADATHQRAKLTGRQARESLANLIQLVEQDVRSAYIEVERTREQIHATAATRKAQEETLRAETEKFRLGKSTALQVAQAQRDLLSSQIAEVQSALAYMKSFVDLYRLDGSLLETRGISAPGGEPVVLDDPRIR